MMPWKLFGPLLGVGLLLLVGKEGLAKRRVMADPVKAAVIELIEDRLAGAWTFRSKRETPCFGTLDLIFPQWHRGDPPGARRRWTHHGYLSHGVKYKVYTAFEHQPAMATAQGVKEVVAITEKSRRRLRTRFTIICRLGPLETWEIVKETEAPF